MQEFFIQVETTIVNDNIKFFIEILDLFGSHEDEIQATDEQYEECTKITREQTCSMLDASQGIVLDESQTQFDKISFGIIMISTFKANLTFSL